MSGQPTRGVQPLAADNGEPKRLVPASWRSWAAFVRHPALPDRADLRPVPAFKTVITLFGLDLALMALLLGALSIATSVGFKMPEHVLGELDLSPGLVAIIVLGGPIVEEIIFRGWLSGRIGHILATPLSIAALLAFITGGAAFATDLGRAQTFLLVGAVCAVLAVAALFFFRNRDALRFFQRHFGWFYWFSVLAFAAIHVSNFASAGLVVAPLVLPQFMLALILGYLRVKHGLWSSMLTHMLHNTVFISLVLVGASAA